MGYDYSEFVFPTGNPSVGGHAGMTFREYYAGMIYVGLLSHPDYKGTPASRAEDAVRHADALIARLNENDDE